MPRQGAVRLGGEFVPTAGNLKARWLFLEAVHACVPEAMDELAQIAPDLPDGDRLTSTNYDPEAPLRAWANKWGFTAPQWPSGPDWLLTVARRTAAFIRTDPSFRTQWVFVASYRNPAGSSQVGLAPWQPIEETESEFRDRVDRHVQATRARASAAGLVTATESRVSAQFTRLALFQVKGLSYRQIADIETQQETSGSSVDVGTIRKGVHETAALIALTLRPARRGRPRRNTQPS